jgi:hypothetical protein
MGSELGEDMGDDFKEMVDQMEAGQMPEDLGGESDGDGFGGMGGMGDDY